MKKLKRSFVAKFAANVLLYLCVMLLAAGAFGILVMVNYNSYERGAARQILDRIYWEKTSAYADEVFFVYYDYSYYYTNGNTSLEYWVDYYAEQYSTENTNFRFTLKTENDNVVLSNYSGTIDETPQFSARYVFSAYHVADYPFDDTPIPTSASPADVEEMQELVNYTLDCYIPVNFTTKDVFSQWGNFVYASVMELDMTIGFTIAFAIIAIVLFVFLVIAAGWRKEGDTVVLRWTDRIPFDLFGAMLFAIGAFGVYLSLELMYYSDLFTNFLAAGIIITIIYALFMLLTISFAARVKAGAWWKNTVIFRFLRLSLRAGRYLFGLCWQIARNLPFLWRTALILAESVRI